MGRKSGGEALLAIAKSSMSKAKTLEGLRNNTVHLKLDFFILSVISLGTVQK